MDGNPPGRSVHTAEHQPHSELVTPGDSRQRGSVLAHDGIHRLQLMDHSKIQQPPRLSSRALLLSIAAGLLTLYTRY